MTSRPRNLQRRKPFAQCSRALTLAIVALPIALAAGCNGKFPGQPDAADRPIPDELVVNFDVLYGRNCAGCHGADGRLGPAPPLNDAIFLAIVPDAELLRAIRAGRRGTPMPAFSQAHGGSLTDAQVSALAAGIKRRWKSANPSAPPADAFPGYLISKAHDEPSTSQDIQLATDVFARACASCHGVHGEQGIGEQVADNQGTGQQGAGKLGAGKTRAGAIDQPAFLSLISDQALRRIIITGRPDLKMPNFADVEGRGAGFRPLTSVEIDELVTLLAAWRQGDEIGAPNHEAPRP